MTAANLRRQRALELFDTLVDATAAQRNARLELLRQEDALLAAELQDLLHADELATGLLDEGVDALLSHVVERLPAPVPDTPIQVGAFRLLRPLGQGGMGEVWLAERRDGAFVQQVALKLLKRGMDSDAVLARFVQERRILAELNHPHIARFVDGGMSADGRPYFVMEYVAGEALIDYANAHRLGIRARVRLLATVCDAVAYAQAHLVVHRDLKPSNILIDGNGQPRILDFGIAKLLGEGAPEEAMTQTGARALSPRYAAPEQVLGESISTATDVYALGTILFELLTGALPQQRQSLSLEALAAMVRLEQAPLPSAVLRRSNPSDQTSATTLGTDTARAVREVSGDLDTIVLTALQREPDRRYAHAAALADDLRRWLDARPIAARADTRGYRLRKFIARNRLAVGSASAVLLALLAGLAIALWQTRIAREQAAVARSEALRAEQAVRDSFESSERTRRVKEFLMQTFIAADTLHRPESAPQTVMAAFDEALKRIDSEVADDPKLQIDLLDDFGEMRVNQGRFEEAGDILDRALKLAEKTYPADSPVVAETLLNQAALLAYQGKLASAADIVERAYAIIEPHAAERPDQFATALSALSALRSSQGRHEEFLAVSRRNVEHSRKFGRPGTDALRAALHNYASALVDSGRHHEAEPYILEALTEVERQIGPNSPLAEKMLTVYSQILYRQGRAREMAQVNDRRISIIRSAYPEGHPSLIDGLADIGWQYFEAGEVSRARACFDEAIELAGGSDGMQAMVPLRYRALLAVQSGDDPAALADFDRALAPCRAGTFANVLCSVIRSNRAGVLARLGHGAEALQEVDAVIAELTANDLLGDNEYAQALESKALALRALGQQEEALATQQRALERYQILFGAEHSEVQRARRNLQKLQE